MAEALMRAANRQPAQPPARRIARIGMEDVEADQRSSDLDTDKRMRRPALSASKINASGSRKRAT